MTDHGDYLDAYDPGSEDDPDDIEPAMEQAAVHLARYYPDATIIPAWELDGLGWITGFPTVKLVALGNRVLELAPELAPHAVWGLLADQLLAAAHAAHDGYTIQATSRPPVHVQPWEDPATLLGTTITAATVDGDLLRLETLDGDGSRGEWVVGPLEDHQP